MTVQSLRINNSDDSQQHDVRVYAVRITGLVQGVGFRPTVWRVANTFGLTGQVCNDGKGVLIHCLIDEHTLQHFIHGLKQSCPPLARIDNIEIVNADAAIDTPGFHITDSEQTGINTGIIADAATCDACLQELFDQSDRRYRYPFLNCTHCGPRFSIVHKIPYDRSNTSMRDFELCASCNHEYHQPADRRFHAQPTACQTCGPHIWLCNKAGGFIACDDAISEAAQHIAAGKIVAIKGIGGIHLACDASNEEAVARLRQRKQRPHKPLALMAKNIEQIKHYCRLNSAEADALASSAAPIVILEQHEFCSLPDNLAPGQHQLGFMLPYSPLHHLLMAELEHPVVMTSGNRSDEPQCIDNDDALNRLRSIADSFLLHNRNIVNRIDDSVVRHMNKHIQVLRRARGYAPGQISLPEGFDDCPSVLAFGAELKSTFCLLQDSHAILSQHMGDLEDARTFDDYQANLQLYLEIHEHQPALLAADMHPEYLSSKLAVNWSADHLHSLTRIQHHHAHIAACMTDNDIGLNDGPVIGVAFDGLGLGDDGTLWGGEFLLADYQHYRRLAHLKAVPLPGAAQAIREPWRNTWAQLHTAFGWQHTVSHYPTLKLVQSLQASPVKALEKMTERNMNSPLTSSCGRLFDAVAAAIGVAPARCSFEGQAAMALEACVDKHLLTELAPYSFALSSTGNKTAVRIIDPAPFWQALLDDLKNQLDKTVIATRFHLGLAAMIVDTSTQLAHEHQVHSIALSGGVFQNSTLLELVADGLAHRNMTVLTHRNIPANDGGIALGQAVITAARHIGKSNFFNPTCRETSCV